MTALVVAMLPMGAAALTATTTTLGSSPNPSTFGQAVTLTTTVSATVSPAAATGKVTFYDGTTVLGLGTLSGGQAMLITRLLASGSHSLKAYYTGNATFAVSLSATVAQTVVALPQNGFLPAVNYNVGSLPQSVAVGDFNGDGKADLAVANYNSTTLSVLLGNGDGTFQPAVNYNIGGFPASVVVGDFNGDGKADLAVANFSNSVSVLLGKGDGTFQAGVNYNAGAQPISVAVGDFNGDGVSDLMVANSNSNNVSILLGLGLPVVNVGGIVNAASFSPDGLVSPGSLVSLFGLNLAASPAAAAGLPLPRTLAGTQVLVNDTAAPLFYVSPTQINFQMPSRQQEPRRWLWLPRPGCAVFRPRPRSCRRAPAFSPPCPTGQDKARC